MTSAGGDPRDPRRRALLQLAVVFVLSILAWFVGRGLDVFEALQQALYEHEHWELDELFGAVLVLGLGTLTFAWLRWRDLKRELLLRRETEQQLHRIAAAVEQAPLSILITDPGGRIEYVNPAFTRMTGYAEEEALGSTPRAFGSGDQDQDLVAALRSAFESGREWRGNLVGHRRDGTRYVQETLIAPVRQGGERPGHLVVIGNDVTENERLRSSLAMTQHVMDHSGDMVMWVDSEARFAYANASALDRLGYTWDEFAALAPWDVVVGLSPAVWKRAWDRIDRARHLKLERGIRCKDGAVVPAELVVTSLRMGDRALQCAIVRDIGDRKRAEAHLAAVNERLRLLLRSSAAAIYTCRTGGDYGATSITENVRDLAGHEPAEFLETASFWADHIHPEDRGRILQEAAEILRTGHHAYEYRFQHRDGTYRWLRDEVRLVRDPSGQPAEMIGVWTDITQRVEAEAVLRRAEARHRALLDGLPDPLFVLDRQGIFLNCYATDTASLPAAPESMLGRTVGDVLPREAAEQLSSGLDHALHTREIQTISYSLPMTSGIRHFEARVVPLEADTAMVVTRDVTRMRESTQRLRDILEHSTNLFYSHTTDHRLVYVSPQCRAFFDCDAEEAMVRWTEFVSDHPGNQVGWERTQKAIATGLPQPPYELEIVTRQGRRLWVEVNEAPVVEHGATVAIVGSLTDITERKLAQGRQARAEQLLNRAQKMEAIGRLAGGVAHDFNNLLTVIMGHAQLMKSRVGPDERLRSDLDEVLKASSRAALLTRQLLTFSRQHALETRPVSLNTIVSDLGKMLRRLIGEDIDLVIAPAADLGLTMADAGQIEQVLMNLAVNARDAMPEGGRLTIESANIDMPEGFEGPELQLPPGRYVMLAVSDTGTGMTADVRHRAFDPFFTTKDVGSGTGLGLAIVHGIVTQSGGAIELQSAPGQGTTLKIYLPRTDASVPAGEAARESSEPPRGSETLLVVEDEGPIRNLVCRTLEMLGYTVLEATDPREALAICERGDQPVDLLVTDIVMPHMSGSELAERAARCRPGLPVLFMSGYADRDLVHQSRRHPNAAFLQKPFTPELLARKVCEVLATAA